MNTETVVMCIVALVLGMLMANMLKNVCGCKTVEGAGSIPGKCVDYVDETPSSPTFQQAGGTLRGDQLCSWFKSQPACGKAGNPNTETCDGATQRGTGKILDPELACCEWKYPGS